MARTEDGGSTPAYVLVVEPAGPVDGAGGLVRRVVEDALAARYRVVPVRNDLDALRATMAEGFPALLVLPAGPPSSGGFDVVGTLRAEAPGLPVVFYPRALADPAPLPPPRQRGGRPARREGTGTPALRELLAAVDRAVPVAA